MFRQQPNCLLLPPRDVNARWKNRGEWGDQLEVSCGIGGCMGAGVPLHHQEYPVFWQGMVETVV